MAAIHGATLNATVNPNGLDTTVKFLYGTDPSLVGALEVDLPLVPAGQGVVPIQTTITGLDAVTTIYFKVSATNSAGTTDGDILNFLTLIDTGSPVVETLAATDIV